MSLFLLADAALVLTLLPSPGPVRPAGLSALYVLHGIVQALDVHSTLRVVSRGQGREGNPVLRGVVDQPLAFIAVKAVAAASTIWLAEVLWKKGYRRTAMVTVLAINLLLAGVVARNYRMGP